MNELFSRIQTVVSHFFPTDTVATIDVLKAGIINKTYRVGTDTQTLLVQTINTNVFKAPEAMMKNIALVTEHLKEKNRKQDILDNRKNLTFYETTEGLNYFVFENEYWRISSFIEGAASYDDAHSPLIMEKAGRAFGRFAKNLADIDIKALKETIPGFHDTESRLLAFWKNLEEKGIPERVLEAEEEIGFIRQYGETYSNLSQRAKKGTIPLRVTHNDTKTNNILFDKDTQEFLCIIDLDTVMPGLACYDVADSIRFSANTGAEDEADLSKVSLDLKLYEAFVKGYLEESKEFLTREEIESIVEGILTITFEQGLRFLDDYLQGDTYYQIARPKQNLDRARCQFHLLKDMQRKQSSMEDFVNLNFQNSNTNNIQLPLRYHPSWGVPAPAWKWLPHS